MTDSDTNSPTLRNLFGETLEGLQAICIELGLPKFRAKQLFDWIYNKRVTSFSDMLNLSKELREKLAAAFHISWPEIIHTSEAGDGTVKYMLQNGQGKKYEAVWLPFTNRVSICISSQIGCSLDCTFCATGKIDMQGNLSAGDIVGQVLAVEAAQQQRATNIVFMGMGEPFYNYDNVITAAGLLSDNDGINFSNSKITISTAGVLPRINRYIEEGHKFGLAISLNHSNDKGRSKVMPINDKYDMAALREAAVQYTHQSGKRITFEYVMMAGENISKQDADRLMKYVGQLNCKINLIPLNTAFPGMKRPTQDEIDQFARWLEPLKERGVGVFNRKSPAKSINGACGMLALKMS